MSRLSLPLKILVVPVLFLGGWLLFCDYNNYSSPGISLFAQLQHPQQMNSIKSISDSSIGLKYEFDPNLDPYIVIDFKKKLSFFRYLRIQVHDQAGVDSLDIYQKLQGNPGFNPKHLSKRIIKSKPVAEYDFLLFPGRYDSLRLDFEGKHTEGSLAIQDVRLLDFSFFFYTESYFYLIGIAVFILIVLPGSMLYSLFIPRSHANSEDYLLQFFLYSLCFYTFLYCILELSLRLALPSRMIVGTSLVCLLSVLAVCLALKSRIELFKNLLHKERKSLIACIALVLACSFLLTRLSKEPFQFDNINWFTTHGDAIFCYFTGHDNMFQWINGKAIENNEPFSAYYGGRRQLYDVQDREMLPGVVFAVVRAVISAVSPHIGESFLVYSFVAIAMQIMVIFPLIVLVRRYYGNISEYFFVLILSLNNFVLANYYFAWFKFSGAALFLCGLTMLIRDKQSLFSWIFAGLAFGFSANMHAGNALGLPLIFLWCIFQMYQEKGQFSKELVLYPALLCLCFIAVNLPWAIVKSHYFPSHYTLIKEHYLPGQPLNRSLADSIKDFFSQHPISEQIVTRCSHLYHALRLEQLPHLFATWKQYGFLKFVESWCNSEFIYLAVSLYPLLTISFVIKMLEYIKEKFFEIRPNGVVILSQLREARSLSAISLGTIILLILASYHHYPDATHHLPMGVTLLFFALLIGYSMNKGRMGKILLLINAGIVLFRISYLFIEYI